MLDEFCPVPESLRAVVCTVVEGQLVSKDKPCPEYQYCCEYMTALAGAWPGENLLAKEKPQEF